MATKKNPKYSLRRVGGPKPKLKAVDPSKIPSSADLRAHMPLVYDQLQENSCTGNGWAAMVAFWHLFQGLPRVEALDNPSRRFIYFNERVLEKTTDKDEGALVADGYKAIEKWGVCAEPMCPYDEALVNEKPSDEAYAAATQFKLKGCKRLAQDLDTLRSAIGVDCGPVVFGMQVYKSGLESDECAASGVVSMPRPRERSQGGHCVVLCGYDDSRKAFLVRNSWGPGWGLEGYFWLPYEYVTSPKLASDFTVLNR